MYDELERSWPVWLPAALRDRLLAAYDDPGRSYHDRRHLSEVIARIRELDPTAGDAVLLAAWFHDAVYVVSTGAESNEEHSARWAESGLTGAGAPENLVAEVARLVRLTETHGPADGDRSGQVLCDADLAILAAGPERYAEYTAGVRTEYAHFSDAEFAAGRTAVLRNLLGRAPLFHTAAGAARWEQPARQAMVRELSALEPVNAPDSSPPPGKQAPPPTG